MMMCIDDTHWPAWLPAVTALPVAGAAPDIFMTLLTLDDVTTTAYTEDETPCAFTALTMAALHSGHEDAREGYAVAALRAERCLPYSNVIYTNLTLLAGSAHLLPCYTLLLLYCILIDDNYSCDYCCGR